MKDVQDPADWRTYFIQEGTEASKKDDSQKRKDPRGKLGAWMLGGIFPRTAAGSLSIHTTLATATDTGIYCSIFISACRSGMECRFGGFWWFSFPFVFFCFLFCFSEALCIVLVVMFWLCCVTRLLGA